MKCEDVRNLFSEYFDDETEMASEITLHLDRCSDCRKEFEEYHKLLIDVANIEEPDVPDGFHQALVSYADGFYRGRKKHISITSHRFASVFGSLAAAAAAVLIVWFTGAFDTSPALLESPQMLAEVAAPQAAADAFEDVYDIPEYFPRARHFDFDDETYDFYIGVFDEPYPFVWHYMTTDEFTGEEISAFIIPEADTFVFFDEPFFEPIIIEVGYMGSPVIRPRFATAVVFLMIGLFLGYHLHRLNKYLERKSDNAP